MKMLSLWQQATFHFTKAKKWSEAIVSCIQ